MESFLKASNKDKTDVKSRKGGGGTTSKTVDALANCLFVEGLPEDPTEKVLALEQLVKTTEKIEDIIESAKNKILTPTQLGITKMASEEARVSASGRTKAMKEALAAAKRADEGKGNNSTTDSSSTPSAPVVGLSAAKSAADSMTQLGSSKKTKEKKQSGGVTDMAKLGKHLLK